MYRGLHHICIYILLDHVLMGFLVVESLSLVCFRLL